MTRINLSYKKDMIILSGKGILVMKINRDNLDVTRFDQKRGIDKFS